MNFVNDVVWPGLVSGSLFALVALGINMVERVTKVVNFAHAQLIYWAPLATLLLTRQFDVPVALAFVLATLGVVAAALVEERVAIRPFLRRGSALPWILSTLAVGTLLERAAYYQFSGEPQAFTYNLGQGPIDLAGIRTTGSEITIIVVALVLVGAVTLFWRSTLLGRRLNAVAEDLDGATSVGISAARASQLVMVGSGLVAAVTGFVAAPSLQVGPSLGLSLLFNGFVAAAIGGIGSLPGSLLGGLSLGLLLQFANVHFGTVAINAVLFGTLLVVYLVRPQGLFGDRVLRSV
ncbi:branched-chain amino acid ABC transporter permease [Frankia sp. CNm7]|uniref:Branched-chain amino acid ABC transporter permease n=1 Tax=Frankia nepalensis TaxID=1836974 RepID=A0A937RMZ9_9ACTN|nr:branched-chain amino acid ABC transporter permease [Frankia nepalensis]MBL7499481.1 branched-chain amino acid ABC transporter permease [Frankia nepalensis]MBL7515364.1 branched-chain amino acid ABC transporter permease [Frankia nepalensis]MBL7523081.1 branched-chain amino acid ABC transporter permease [Frankia nepalensis]MBL7631855.1 branched-chain amino acid ABC transporter permease [Frankia nepalensis]